MNRNFTISRFLTDAHVRMMVFSLFVLIPFQSVRATGTDTAPIINSTTYTQSQQDTPLNADDKSYRIHQLMHYIRSQVPTLLPNAPSYVRDPGSWALNGVRDIRDELGLEETGEGGSSMVASVASPLEAMVQAPPPEQREAMWMTPDYHHMGFLPAHDAMVLGVGMRHTLIDSHVQMEVRPFWGQNWHGLENYGGSEVAVNLYGESGQRWGKIALRYIEGDDDMLDHGHGTDLHAELRFNDHLALHAGVRQSDDESLGNYILLRWRLATIAPLSAH